MENCITKLKLLSAALIAAAVFATPAMARKGHVTSRHLAQDTKVGTTPSACYIDERSCHLTPRVGAFVTAPWGEDNCDVGDNPRVC
jgi:hypothetical protein